MKNIFALAALMIVVSLTACSKPMASAKVADEILYVSRDFAATPNDSYYAIKWALNKAGYPVDTENLQDGILTSTWVPVKSDSHYISVFGRPDMGVTNSYHQLEVQVVPSGGRTEIKVGSRIKSLVPRLQSSGIEERKILALVGNFLRKGEPDVTNLGVDE